MSRKIKPNGPNTAKKVSKPKRSSRQGQKSQRVQAPVAKSLTLATSRPQTRSDNGDIIITHREYIMDVPGAIPFQATPLPVNPGIAASFPWLSTIAPSYESYIFESLEFHYETQAPTSSTGSIILAMDYDSNDLVPTSKSQVMSYRGSVRSAPWSSSCHRSQKEDVAKRKSYFVRRGTLAANQDKNLYDCGQFYLCRQGQVDTSVVGELYVSYRVRLMTPQLGEVGPGEAIFGYFFGSSNSAPVVNQVGPLPVTVTTSGTTASINIFRFSQQWEGYVTVAIVGTGLTGVVGTGSSIRVELLEVIDAGALSMMAFYKVTANPNETFTLTLNNTTITSSTVFFGQADN